MDHAAYHVVYVDKRVSRDLDGKHLQKIGPADVKLRRQGSYVDRKPDCFDIILPETEEVRNNLKSVLTTFNGVHPCSSGSTCMAKLAQFESLSSHPHPTLVIMEMIVEIEVDDRSGHPSLASTFPAHSLASAEQNLVSTVSDPKDRYGLSLLQHISSEICNLRLSKSVVPIAMIHNWEINTTFGSRGPITRPSRPYSGDLNNSRESSSVHHRDSTFTAPVVNPRRLQKCLDAGAVDVLVSPLQPDRVYNLTAHAYRARYQASEAHADTVAASRSQKRPWFELGNYARLLEDMVSELVMSVCNSEHVPHGFNAGLVYTIDHSEDPNLATAIGTWGFSAHEFSEEQLVQAAFLMLRHALSMPELEKWRISASDLGIFILASRAAYNSFVHYHNFRHVVDVMQAIFYFLLQLGILPPYPASTHPPNANIHVSPIAALLRPFDALTLLISAIGHDVGHPGVNNAFLVSLKAPVAQLYNDKSVLESFHCAAYSQILRRYWKQAYEDTSMRGLLINSILATDMGLHFKYMSDLKDLTEATKDKGTSESSSQTLDEYRILTCALLIKCADISNVARPFDIAAKWSDILQLEFANQGKMEKNIGVPTTLFGGPPELGNLVKLANSQIGFMKIFARPLFEGISTVLPTMDFAVHEMKTNHGIWDDKIKQENIRGEPSTEDKMNLSEDSVPPRSESPSRSSSQPELSHPEGLPASRGAAGDPLPSNSSLESVPNRERSLASGVSDPTPSETPDLSPGSRSQDSRRSSLGFPPGYVSSRPDSTSYSRRSSGAYPTANPIIPNSSTKRSSNTVPSQLQLGPAIDTGSQVSTPARTDENIQPGGRGSEDLSWKPNPVTSAYAPLLDGGGVLLATDSGRGGGGDRAHRGFKGGDTYKYRSAHYTTTPATGHSPALPSHNRDSSGAQISISHSQPYSPTDTQATSFLTVDSDDKGYHAGTGWNSPPQKEIPSVVDVERPGSGHKHGESKLIKGSDVRTSVTKGHASSIANGIDGHRPVPRRKSSRFLTFWKKRGKTMDASL